MILYQEARNQWAENLLYREAGPDIDCIREQRREYGLIDWANHDVLDLGANIGAFARFAVMHGAEFVTCVEPDKGNIEVFKANMMTDVMYLYEAAVNNDGQSGELYLANNDQHWSHTTVPLRGRESVSVNGVALKNLVWNQTAIKCDIEGGEYGLDWSVLADTEVRTVIMELHLTKREWRRVEAPKLFEAFAELGFTINNPEIPEKSWNMVRSWTR